MLVFECGHMCVCVSVVGLFRELWSLLFLSALLATLAYSGYFFSFFCEVSCVTGKTAQGRAAGFPLRTLIVCVSFLSRRWRSSISLHLTFLSRLSHSLPRSASPKWLEKLSQCTYQRSWPAWPNQSCFTSERMKWKNEAIENLIHLYRLHLL